MRGWIVGLLILVAGCSGEVEAIDETYYDTSWYVDTVTLYGDTVEAAISQYASSARYPDWTGLPKLRLLVMKCGVHIQEQQETKTRWFDIWGDPLLYSTDKDGFGWVTAFGGSLPMYLGKDQEDAAMVQRLRDGTRFDLDLPFVYKYEDDVIHKYYKKGSTQKYTWSLVGADEAIDAVGGCVQ